MDRPIPAFYCCYLLRSTVRHASLYVGSTPNPARRLKQHNHGIKKGGAKRTDTATLKPWDMVCLVTGFPSKIAALQFEWAWQRPDVTRHINAADRITNPKITTVWSKKYKKYVTKVRCPTLKIAPRLSNLRLLLRSPSFRQWPLSVRFYSPDVYAVWNKMIEQTIGDLPASLIVALETTKHSHPDLEPTGAAAIDPTYIPMKSRLERSRALLKEAKPHNCSICCAPLCRKQDLVLTCPTEACGSVSHLDCLSRDFLSSTDAVLPRTGQCRDCSGELEWSSMVKDLSLRIRGRSVLEELFKVPRAKKATAGVEEVETIDEAKERRLSGFIEGDEEGDVDEDDLDTQLSEAIDDIGTAEADRRQDSDVKAGASSTRTAGRSVVADSDSDAWGEAEVLV